MKKITLSIAAIALLAITLTSCKKDYTCTCTYTDSLGTHTTDTPITHAKKKDATDACNTLNTLEALVGGTCTLK